MNVAGTTCSDSGPPCDTSFWDTANEQVETMLSHGGNLTQAYRNTKSTSSLPQIFIKNTAVSSWVKMACMAAIPIREEVGRYVRRSFGLDVFSNSSN